MRACIVFVLLVLAGSAIQVAQAIDATLCAANNLNQCQTACVGGTTPVQCGDGSIACRPTNSGNEDTCCGCRGNACTLCEGTDYCLRSPDASSSWECSRFPLGGGQGQRPLYERLSGLKCALNTNDIHLNPVYPSASIEYSASALSCLNQQFNANNGQTTNENLNFNCDTPDSYRRVCGENKGTMCTLRGYMSNWRSFPQGALVANFTSQVCVPNDCRDLSYEPLVQGFFNRLPVTSFCVNSTNPTDNRQNSVCFTQVECSAPPAGPISADSQLIKNNEYNAGLIALLVIIAVAVIAGVVLLVVFKK